MIATGRTEMIPALSSPPEVGRIDPEHVIGVHVTQIFSFPSGDPAELAGLSKEDMGKVQYLQWFMENMGTYNKLQSTQQQTLSHALADSPAGQLAWSTQLFGDAVSSDYILTNVMIYWLTNTAASSARFYQRRPEGPCVNAWG